jgi:hypothetical protein
MKFSTRAFRILGFILALASCLGIAIQITYPQYRYGNGVRARAERNGNHSDSEEEIDSQGKTLIRISSHVLQQGKNHPQLAVSSVYCISDSYTTNQVIIMLLITLSLSLCLWKSAIQLFVILAILVP